MIEFQQMRDRRKFLKPNLAIAKRSELDAERQRLAQGRVTQIRRPMIDKIYRVNFIPKI